MLIDLLGWSYNDMYSCFGSRRALNTSPYSDVQNHLRQTLINAGRSYRISADICPEIEMASPGEQSRFLLLVFNQINFQGLLHITIATQRRRNGVVRSFLIVHLMRFDIFLKHIAKLNCASRRI